MNTRPASLEDAIARANNGQRRRPAGVEASDFVDTDRLDRLADTLENNPALADTWPKSMRSEAAQWSERRRIQQQKGNR